MNQNTETHYDQTVEFTYEGRDYIWQGDYSIEYTGELEGDYAPPYGEAEAVIDHTTSLSYYDEDLEVNVEVKPTLYILMELALEITNNL